MLLIDYIMNTYIIIKRKKTRSFLAIICIMLGVITIITTFTINTSSLKYIKGEFSKLGGDSIVISCKMNSTNSSKNIHINDKEFLTSLFTEIKSIHAVSSQSGKIDLDLSVREATVYGVESQYIKFSSLEMLKGKFITDLDYNMENYVVVISNTLAIKAFNNLDCIGKYINIRNSIGTIHAFKIVGIYKNPVINDEDSTGIVLSDEVFIPLSTVIDFYNTDNINYIQFKINGDEGAFKKVSNKSINALEIKHNVKNSFFASNSIEAKKQYTNMINIITSIFLIFGLISIILGGINLVNILLITIKERYKEIGIRKSVGASNYNILMQFLTESIIITVIGGVIGAILGFLLGKLLMKYIGIACIFQFKYIYISLLLNIIIAIVFGIYPAYKAAKLPPKKVLQSN